MLPVVSWLMSAAWALDPGDRAPSVAPDGVDVEGRVVLVNFWATWCGPCRAELPRLQALDQRLASQGARVVTVNIDTNERAAQAVLARAGVLLPVVWDPEGTVASAFDPPAMPTSYLVGTDGVVLEVWSGGLDEAAVAAVEARMVAAAGGGR